METTGAIGEVERVEEPGGGAVDFFDEGGGLDGSVEDCGEPGRGDLVGGDGQGRGGVEYVVGS